MEELNEIALDGTTYVWDGKRWYQTRTFLTPPTATVYKLHFLLMQALQEEDHNVSDLNDLLSRARQAEDALQHERAGGIARRVLKAEPRHPAAAEVLCSALRGMNQPSQALKETQALKDIDYVPLLVSRAAAFCDLEKWPEAMNEVTRAREAGGGELVALVAKRIKGKARTKRPKAILRKKA